VGVKKLRNTTNEIDINKAKSRAVDIVMNAWFREKNQLPIVSKRFKSVAELAIKRMEEANEAGHGKATYRSYILALKNYHIPYLGKYVITNLDYATLERFSKWRENKLTRRPSASTLNTHNSAISRVFDEALMRGFIVPTQVPVLTNQGVKGDRRPSFTEQEYKQLYTFMRKWAPAGRRGHEYDLRMLLRDYVLILANTGLRAGTETMNLKWQHVAIIEHNGKRYLEMTIRGKTGKRTILVRHRVARYLQRIQERDAELSKMSFQELIDRGVNQYVFRKNEKDISTPLGRMFSRVLESAGLLMDKQSETKRTLYSLRHFYATRTLTRTDITPYQLAEFMGTSIAMIKTHYGHLDLRNIADKFAGTDTTIELELRKTRLVDEDGDEKVESVKKATDAKKTPNALKTSSAKKKPTAKVQAKKQLKKSDD
jgi:integrase